MLGIQRKKTGWIGIDVGTSHVKVAQVVQSNKRWELAAAAIVPRTMGWDFTSADSGKYIGSSEEMATAADLRRDLLGKNVAAALPMSICRTHQVDGALDTAANRQGKLRQLVEAATCQPAAHLQCAAWHAETPEKGTSPLKTNIISAPQIWTDNLAQEISSLGWNCRTIDGAPLALARAVSMVLPRKSKETWAALDWGYTQATVCIVHNRRPVYVRPLKNCGFKQVLQSITSELDIDEKQAVQLLEEHDLSTANRDQRAQVILDSISGPIEKLEFEIQRTMSHLQTQRRQIIPQGVFMFGGGSAVNGIAPLLTERLGLEHRRWQFGNGQQTDNLVDANWTHLLGPAIALSALAWEKR